MSASHKPLKILLLLSLTATVVCIAGLNRELQVYHQAEQFYQVEPPRETTSSPISGITPRSCSTRLNLARERFPNSVGWIWCPDTELDYPIMQAADNTFYLNHLADGTDNPLGSIFLDANAAPDFSSPVSALYGHTTKQGQMFSSLTEYRTQAYYEAHPTIWLCTWDTDYVIDLLAAYLVDGSSSYPQNFADDQSFLTFVAEAKEQSFFDSSAEVQPNDRLVVLSTCDESAKNTRLAVLGRLRTSHHTIVSGGS